MIGECTGRFAKEAQGLGWGRMWIARDRNIYTYPGEPWGLDNGAFRDWSSGKPFDGDQFRRVLDKTVSHHAPHLAVIPDAPGDGARTLEMANEWLPNLPAMPWYLAVQDGVVLQDVAPFVSRITGIFLGGTNTYKATADAWCSWAHANGLRFHYGRCGTQEKLRHAIHVGADSIDSATPMWEQGRWDLFKRWVTRGPCQRDLLMTEA